MGTTQTAHWGSFLYRAPMVVAWGKTKLQSQRRDPKHLAGPDRSGSMFVRGVTEVEISNMTEALDLLRVGQLARQVLIAILQSSL